MGQEVDRTTFSRHDRQQYRTQRPAVSRRARRDAARPPVRPRRADDRRRGGAEPRGGDDLEPAPRRRPCSTRSASPEFQTELGRWNLELNLPPRPLPGDEWRHFEQQLLDELAMARAKAAGPSAPQLAVIGILPTLAAPAPGRATRCPPDDRYLAAQRADAQPTAASPSGSTSPAATRSAVGAPSTWSPTSTRSPPRRRARRCSCTCRWRPRRSRPTGTPRSAWRACSWRSARTPRSCWVRGCGRRPGSRCSSSRATCARPSCATRAYGRGCGSASGGSARSSTCSRRTAATSRA